MKFSDIPGHEDVKTRLRTMADTGRVPHALLLEGPEGAGKFALARAFVQYLHCENRTPGGDCCGTCPSCRQHESFNQIDTHFVFPVVKRSGGKPAISDDYLPEFRDFITDSPFMDLEGWFKAIEAGNSQPQIFVDEGAELLRKLNFKARSAAYKAVLLWLPERLKAETANKLLKLIEEPHPDTIFVLVSNNPAEVLPTIYSRTQRVHVNRYSDDEIAMLLAGKGVEGNLARELAALTQGSVNSALHLCSGKSEKGKSFLDLFADLMRKGFARKLPELRKWSLDMAANGRETQMQFVDYCSRILRESLMMHTSAGQYITTLTPEEQAFCSRFHPFVNERNVIGLFNAMNDAHRDIAANANAKIVFFDLTIKILMLIRK